MALQHDTVVMIKSWIWSTWCGCRLRKCHWYNTGWTSEFPLMSEIITVWSLRTFVFFFFLTVWNAANSLVWIHRSSLARWRIQTAVWIYSGSFWASKCVRSETGRGGKGGENKFKGRLTDTTSICHLAPRTIKGLCEWSLLLEKRAARRCWFLAAVDKLSKA